MEISLLLKVSDVIGGLRTILFVIFTAVLGAYLVKQQGIATLAKFQQEAQAGRIPAQQMLEGIALLFAGAVLLTPGFVTDAIGFLLLIPLTRRLIIAYLIENGKGMSGFQAGAAHFGGVDGGGDPYSHSNANRQSGGNVIEGEYTDTKDQTK